MLYTPVLVIQILHVVVPFPLECQVISQIINLSSQVKQLFLEFPPLFVDLLLVLNPRLELLPDSVDIAFRVFYVIFVILIFSNVLFPFKNDPADGFIFVLQLYFIILLHFVEFLLEIAVKGMLLNLFGFVLTDQTLF